MSPWNHAALIVDEDGGLIEATFHGLRKSHLREYRHQPIRIIRPQLTTHDREHVVKYAYTMLHRHEKYGFVTIVSIALKILTRSRLIIKFDDTAICSEFVANALFAGGFIWDKDTALITPADLYNTFRDGGV